LSEENAEDEEEEEPPPLHLYNFRRII
jgi:hypothetical protein